MPVCRRRISTARQSDPEDKVQKLEQQAPSLSENEVKVSSPNAEPPHLTAILALIAVSIFVIALSGMPNLMDNERHVAAYVLDAVQNGNWICQRDTTGDIASKPPMYTWIAALATLPFGRINRFSLSLPSALATLAVGLIIFRIGRAQLGWQSGFLAALAYLLSPLADRQVTLPRYDGLFTVPVALGVVVCPAQRPRRRPSSLRSHRRPIHLEFQRPRHVLG